MTYLWRNAPDRRLGAQARTWLLIKESVSEHRVRHYPGYIRFVRCVSCGQENPAGFRFCGSCGVALIEAVPVREMRKVVSVVFCDLSGSTALGERTDPEVLRTRMRGYYEQMRPTVALTRRSSAAAPSFSSSGRRSSARSASGAATCSPCLARPASASRG